MIFFHISLHLDKIAYLIVGAPNRVSRDTRKGFFKPRDTGFVKKISQDTGLIKLTGCGIMPKINTGYGKEPFFWRDTGLIYATGHQKIAFESSLRNSRENIVL